MMNANNCGVSGGASGSDGANYSWPCGACKFLKRKCSDQCLFAPYFEPTELGVAEFGAVHKVFGTSNFTKLLKSLSEQDRLIAAITTCFEAKNRLNDPVYGSVAHILSLQRQVSQLKRENAKLQGQLRASNFGFVPPLPPPPPPPQAVVPPSLAVDVPVGSPWFSSHDMAPYQPVAQPYQPVVQPSVTIPPEQPVNSPRIFSTIEELRRELLGDDTDPMD